MKKVMMSVSMLLFLESCYTPMKPTTVGVPQHCHVGKQKKIKARSNMAYRKPTMRIKF